VGVARLARVCEEGDSTEAAGHAESLAPRFFCFQKMGIGRTGI
jgi:hypothetical protein